MQESLFKDIELNEAVSPPLQQCSVSRCTLLHGDCLELMKHIPDGSIDLVLTDMPYGTVKGAKFYDYANGCEWDEVLNMEKVWAELNRVTRPLANVLLFSQEPFSTQLINSSIRNIPFGYRCIWKKDNFANPLIAKKLVSIIMRIFFCFYEIRMTFLAFTHCVNISKTSLIILEFL